MATGTPYDYKSWQLRMGWTNQQAAEALDISESMLATLKRNGSGRPLYMWAAYGLEMAEHYRKQELQKRNANHG